MVGWILKVAGRFFVHGITLLGAVALFFDFSPKISVSPYTSIDPLDPFSAPFIIANDGYMPLNAVSATCLLKDVEFEDLKIANTEVADIRMDLATQMAPAEKLTVKCRFRENLGIATVLKKADILIIIDYRPWLLPTTGQRQFRFEAAHLLNDSWEWLPLPVAKN